MNPSLFQDYLKKLKPQVKEITVEELVTKCNTSEPGEFHILDVRESAEWNKDRIPFSKYTGRGFLEKDVESIVPNVNHEIVVYCAGGIRSILAADTLQRMGYSNVSSLMGGIAEYNRKFPHPRK